MPFFDAAKNVMLDELAALAVKMSCHTAVPNSSGSNEVAGGTYARQTVSWNAAASGEATLAAQETFAIPASTTVAYLGLWNNAENVFYGYMVPVGGSVVFTSAGDLIVQTGTKLDINDS